MASQHIPQFRPLSLITSLYHGNQARKIVLTMYIILIPEITAEENTGGHQVHQNNIGPVNTGWSEDGLGRQLYATQPYRHDLKLLCTGEFQCKPGYAGE